MFRQLLEPILIGMPQLGPYGLSENWLLRHLGDAHWQIICNALDRPSRNMVDEAGNRLYASFARVCWISTVPLSAYRESDTLSGWMEMRRYGDGIFVSTAKLFDAANGVISATLASIFTRREGESNDRLLASAPAIFDDCPIADCNTPPPFLDEHRLIRAATTSVHNFMKFAFDTGSPVDQVVEYRINGYQDFNGANLLYFASYPTIADICASRTQYVADHFGFERFVTDSSPIGRDIFYFGNANLGDWISCGFKLNTAESGGLAARVDLVRKESGALIGKQFVIRERPAAVG